MTLEARIRAARGAFELDVELAARPGVTAVFGVSGAGKTTLLRCLAGLERVAGRVAVDGVTWQDEAGAFVPPHRRALGYVFQEPSLFPHLSVRANVEYGLRRVPAAERRVSFEDAVERLGVASLLERSTGDLSGGERQRVALARALASSPRLVLLDEPLAALDAASRREILPYLERLARELEVPVLYVSHSLQELARLADDVLWLDAGRVRSSGALHELLARPDVWSAVEEDALAVLDATVEEHDSEYELTCVRAACGPLWMPRLAQAVGTRVRVRIAARDVSLSLEDEVRSTILNRFPVRVDAVGEPSGGQVLLSLDCGGEARVLARITRRSRAELGLERGMRAIARVKSVSLAE